MNQADYVGCIITKLSKYIKINKVTSSDSFYRTFFENNREPGTSLPNRIFVEFFDRNMSFVIWHKLVILHDQTVFTSQVIQ